MLPVPDCELAALRAAIRRAGQVAEQFWLALMVTLGLTLDILLLGPRVAEAIARNGIGGAALGAACQDPSFLPASGAHPFPALRHARTAGTSVWPELEVGARPAAGDAPG